MDLASLCQREVIGIAAEASLADAAALMGAEHVGALVVMTGDTPPKVVGLVTDRDLALEALAGKRAAVPLQVGYLAKSPPVAVPSKAGVREALATMERAGVRRLLVVDDDGGVVGIVSTDDLVGAVAEELETLARALRVNIEREKSPRGPARSPPPARPVFPAFGLVTAE
jgi:CBS domain-containing protein